MHLTKAKFKRWMISLSISLQNGSWQICCRYGGHWKLQPTKSARGHRDDRKLWHQHRQSNIRVDWNEMRKRWAPELLWCRFEWFTRWNCFTSLFDGLFLCTTWLTHKHWWIRMSLPSVRIFDVNRCFSLPVPQLPPTNRFFWNRDRASNCTNSKMESDFICTSIRLRVVTLAFSVLMKMIWQLINIQTGAVPWRSKRKAASLRMNTNSLTKNRTVSLQKGKGSTANENWIRRRNNTGEKQWRYSNVGRRYAGPEITDDVLLW